MGTLAEAMAGAALGDRDERLRIGEAAGAGSMVICRVMLGSSITKELAGRAMNDDSASGI